MFSSTFKALSCLTDHYHNFRRNFLANGWPTLSSTHARAHTQLTDLTETAVDCHLWVLDVLRYGCRQCLYATWNNICKTNTAMIVLHASTSCPISQVYKSTCFRIICVPFQGSILIWWSSLHLSTQSTRFQQLAQTHWQTAYLPFQCYDWEMQGRGRFMQLVSVYFFESQAVGNLDSERENPTTVPPCAGVCLDEARLSVQ